RPLYSWRVLLLPYLEQQNLYDQFRLDEPWDSPNNAKVSSAIVAIYAAPGRVSNKTPYQLFYSSEGGNDGAAFIADPTGTKKLPVVAFGAANRAGNFQLKATGPRVRIPASFPDGTSNTILVAEAAELVPWAKPADLHYHPKQPLPRLG